MKDRVITHACIAAAAFIAAAAIIAAVLAYNVLSTDTTGIYGGESYERSVIFESEEQFDKFISDNRIAPASNRQAQDGFVAGMAKTVWVDERYMLTRGAFESRIVSQSEAEARGDELLSLTIAVMIAYDEGKNAYEIEAYAGWGGNEATEPTLIHGTRRGLDFLGATWGGDMDGGLDFAVQDGKYSGAYAGGETFEAATCNADSGLGYVWMLEECSESGFVTQSCLTIDLKTIRAEYADATDFSLIYAHSYSDTMGAPELQRRGEHSPTLSTNAIGADFWQIEINIENCLEF